LNKKIGIPVFIVIVAILLVVAWQFNLFGTPMSIVAVSNIVTADGQTWVQAVLTPNNSGETFWFVGHDSVQGSVDGQEVKQSNYDVAVRFKPEQFRCELPLRADSKDIYYFGIKLGTYQYFIADQTAFHQDSPVGIEVLRKSPNGVFQTIATRKLNIRTNETVTVTSFLPTLSVGSNLPTLKIEKLGSLSGERNCPDASNIAIVSRNGEMKAVDRTQLVSRLESPDWFRIGAVCTGILTNPTGYQIDKCFNSVIDYFYTDIDPAPDIVNSRCNPSYQSCEGIMELTNEKFVYTIPDRYAVSLLTMRMNREFVGGFVFEAANGVPRISMNPTRIDLKKNEEQIVKVTVENIGSGTDNFTVIGKDTGNFNITPINVELTSVAPGQRKSFDFRVRAINAVSSEPICFEAFGEKGDDSVCGTIGITEEITFCGNGICNAGLGENCLTCAVDCGCSTSQFCNEFGRCETKPALCGNGVIDFGENCSTCPEDVTCQSGEFCSTAGECVKGTVCSFPNVLVRTEFDEPIYLINIPFIGGFIETGRATRVEESCVLDPNIMWAVIGVVVVGALAVLVRRRFK